MCIRDSPTYEIYPWDCAVFSHFDGDTMFYDLCSIPCDITITSGTTGTICFFCEVSYSTTGVKESTEQGLVEIYPNPTSDIVRVTFSHTDKQQIYLTNIVGELIFFNEVNFVANSPIKIDLSNQPTGIYLLRIGNSTTRILKE